MSNTESLESITTLSPAETAAQQPTRAPSRPFYPRGFLAWEREIAEQPAGAMRQAYESTPEGPEVVEHGEHLIAFIASMYDTHDDSLDIRRRLVRALAVSVLWAALEIQRERRPSIGSNVDELRAGVDPRVQRALDGALDVVERGDAIIGFAASASAREDLAAAARAAGQGGQAVLARLRARAGEIEKRDEIAELLDYAQLEAAMHLAALAAAAALIPVDADRGEYEWRRILTRGVSSVALLAKNLLVAAIHHEFPWSGLPDARAWDAEAPFGRFDSGEPRCSDADAPLDWLNAARALGVPMATLVESVRAAITAVEKAGGRPFAIESARGNVEAAVAWDNTTDPALDDALIDLESAFYDAEDDGEDSVVYRASRAQSEPLAVAAMRAVLPRAVAETIAVASSWRRTASSPGAVESPSVESASAA